MLEAVYSSRGAARRASLPMETAATENEARRVLAWQEDVARSISFPDSHSRVSGALYRPQPSPSARYRRADSYPPMETQRLPLRLVKRETVTRELYRRDDCEGPRLGAGMSHKALIGTLLAVATVVDVAHAAVRSESPERGARHLPPPPGRRASYGGQPSSFLPGNPGDRLVERLPARSYLSARDDVASSRYVAPYAVAASPSRSHGSGDVEGRSSTSYRSERRSDHGSRIRSRSEVGGPRYVERMIRSISPHGSHSSRSVRGVTVERPLLGRSRTDGYTSSGSNRTGSTAKQPSVLYVSSPAPRTSTTTIRVVPKDERRGLMDWDDRRSVLSARHAPLPRSMVSGYEYAGSVAPSDSVSSVGTKRERERLRTRMGW